MNSTSSNPKPTFPVVVSFKVNNRTYERTFVDCGKKGCSRCQGPHGRKASHGPYWYMCASKNGKWRRIYIGFNLDTSRYINPNGSIDWNLIAGRPTESKAISAMEVPKGSIEYPPVKTTAESRHRARFIQKLKKYDPDFEVPLDVKPEPIATDRQAKAP